MYVVRIPILRAIWVMTFCLTYILCPPMLVYISRFSKDETCQMLTSSAVMRSALHSPGYPLLHHPRSSCTCSSILLMSLRIVKGPHSTLDGDDQSRSYACEYQIHIVVLLVRPPRHDHILVVSAVNTQRLPESRIHAYNGRGLEESLTLRKRVLRMADKETQRDQPANGGVTANWKPRLNG